LQRIGRISIATRSLSCASPQSASCSENFAIPRDVSGQTLRTAVQLTPGQRPVASSIFALTIRKPLALSAAANSAAVIFDSGFCDLQLRVPELFGTEARDPVHLELILSEIDFDPVLKAAFPSSEASQSAVSSHVSEPSRSPTKT
jgi:hypothetical protein